MTDMPTYQDLSLPTLKAVIELGGSGAAREITQTVLETENFPDELLSITYEGRDKSILIDRLDWARSYAKLTGALESPQRGLFLVTDLGLNIAGLPAPDAEKRLRELDKRYRKNRASSTTKKQSAGSDDNPPTDLDDPDDTWRESLLSRLHQLTPDGFERMVMYLLRATGMELRRIGGPGDEGIDGIGSASLTAVLTKTVAVQAKRYEPSKVIGRETVALFQSDAHAAGAEHGVLVTTARFSKPARQAALGRHPTIDLVDGDKLTDLCIEYGVGVQTRPVVVATFFDRFDS